MAKGKAGKRTAKAVPKFGPKKSGGGAKKKSKRQAPPGGQEKEHAQEEAAGPNPYDVFQNRRQRRTVLGERVSGARRDVVKSRTAAVTSRTRGLLKDVIGDRRTSKFKDARLGGDADDAGKASSVQRLVKLRQRQAKRSFALGSEADGAGKEDLTHGGKPLAGLEDSELRAGGDLDDDDVEFDPDNPTEGHSRLKRIEAAKEREEQERQLGKLDADFGDIMGELDFRPPKSSVLLRSEPKAPAAAKPVPDEFDKLLKELAFERKATATDRTKSPEELVRERAEQLEALERERALRVNADTGPAKADGDGDEDGEDEDADGEPRGAKRPDAEEASAEAEEEESEEEDEGEESEEEQEGSDIDDGAAPGKDVDEDDRLGEDCISLYSAKEAGHIDIMKNEKGEEGLPYKFECPNRMRAVVTLLADKTPKTAIKVVQRIRACTALSLAPENREKLRGFFLALMEYAVDVVARSDGDLSSRGMQVLYALRPLLMELAREHPDDSHTFFRERLSSLGPDTVPKMTELCTFKLIALIFPVTDFQHPITTPAAVLLDHWAARIAALGAGISDLVSEAVFLWGIFYDFIVPPRRFCSSFFQLGIAILESCWASMQAGRAQVADVAADISAMLLKTLRLYHEADGLAAHVAASKLVRPALRKASEGRSDGTVGAQISSLMSAIDELCAGGLQPLALFETAPPQIKMLEPIFHEIGDASGRRRGMELTETQQLKKKLNEERRAATRQLRRDASTLQQLQSHKDAKRRTAQAGERARVRKIMANEKQELKLMMTENAGGMDTSLQAYSKTKARKKENRRMAGNATAENPKGPSKKAAEAAKPAAKASKPDSDGPRGAKRTKKGR